MSKKIKISLADANPALAAQWHPYKNHPLQPEDVAPNSHMKVWWFLPYYDPQTGHQCFEWPANIDSRNKGRGCPFLAGQAVWRGFNDLQSVNKELAKQWHPFLNGSLKPTEVTASSGKVVWWYLPYDDPKTGHHDFIWPAAIKDRHSGDGCPYLSYSALWPEYNSLAVVEPELAEEFDIEKNGGLTPLDILYCSCKTYWWKCKKGHSWKNSPSDRHHGRHGCPTCAKELQTSFPEQVIYYYMKKIFSNVESGNRSKIGMELDVYIPSVNLAIEYDGSRWHKDVAKDLKKNKECEKKGIRLIRVRENSCPPMDETSNCSIIEIKRNNNNKDLKNAIVQIANKLNVEVDIDIGRDLAEIQSLIDYNEKKNSLSTLFPDVAREWHKTKNGDLNPECVSAYSQKKVWWFLLYDDPKTGKQFPFEWQAVVRSRTSGVGCPYLTNTRAWPGFNDLLTLRPEIAKEWNYDKNKGLTNKRGDDISTPDKVTENAKQKVWWKCSKCDNEWQAIIGNRTILGRGCPACAREKLKQPRKRKTISQSDLEPFDSNNTSA